MSKTQEEFNRVIQHAIGLGTEASAFLHCWNEGNWDGCREFDFEPILPYESASPTPQLLNENQSTHEAIKVQNFGHLGGEGFRAGVHFAEAFYGITKAQT